MSTDRPRRRSSFPSRDRCSPLRRRRANDRRLDGGHQGAEAPARTAPEREMNDDDLRHALVEAAYLEGDFLLRSGKRSRYYLDKFRFSTRPDLLAPLGERIAAAVREHAPDAVRLAAPVLGGVPLAAAASLASGLPFVIVRDKAKEYGTANQI